MLVLARKVNEAIVIGENIRVVVVGVEGETVRLGIEAPREVKVYRQEIFDAIQEANRQAAQAAVAALAGAADLVRAAAGQGAKTAPVPAGKTAGEGKR